MKKIMILISLFLFAGFIFSDEIKNPFLYIPGMFDNGDMFNIEYNVVKTLNDKEGFYYKNYYNENYNYDNYKIICGSNIVNSKYNRLVVANLIGDYRKNIPLELMSERLFCLIHGKAPKFKNFKSLTVYKGNDYSGFILVNNDKIYFQGIIEELWAKYGKIVHYKNINGKLRVLLNPDDKDKSLFFINKDYYYDATDKIKLNVVAHSSGGLALRRYLSLCESNNLDHHINLIINLSVPQKGAGINYKLKDAFPKLISLGLESFYSNLEKDSIKVNGKNFTYKELFEKTMISEMRGDSFKGRSIKKLIGDYILYCIPFDGKNGVLGFDPALYDLHPDHNFIKNLSKISIDANIKIFNYRVHNPYARLFTLISKTVDLCESDGVVEYSETALDNIPGYDELLIKNIEVQKANHISMPYIKPLFELNSTIEKNYSLLKIMLKVNFSKIEGVDLLEALIKGLITEMGLDIDSFMKNENYSVIEYFGENPAAL